VKYASFAFEYYQTDSQEMIAVLYNVP